MSRRARSPSPDLNAEGSPDGIAKRQRIEKRKQETHDENDDANFEADHDQTEAAVSQTAPLSRAIVIGKNNYAVGSIMRIKLVDFLTYDAVEFHPGPNLNVVIGPNGTGKSSIVCAICLGLGGAPNLLGRQKDVKEFIKNGKSKAVIELELCEKNGSTIIRREFSTNGSKTWKLGSSVSTSEKDVKEYVKKLGIQVDNKIQFLPQDMVAEFGRMTPEQLLRATMRAVGGEQREKDFDELIKRYTEDQGLKERLLSIEQEKAELEGKQKAIEREVLAHEEYERRQAKIVIMEKLLPWMDYEDARNEYLEYKEEKLMAQRALQEAEVANGPLTRQLEQAKEAAAAALIEMEKKHKAITKGVNDATEIQHKLAGIAEEYESKTDSLIDNQNLLKKSHKAHGAFASLIEKKEQDIAALQQQVARASDSEARLRELDQQIRDVSMKVTNLQTEQSRAKTTVNTSAQTQGNVQAQLDKLKNVVGQRGEFVKSNRHDVYVGMQWVQSNRARLSGHVHGPILTTIEMKDTRNARYLEMFLSQDDLYAFICEEEADQLLLIDELRTKKKLKVNIGRVSQAGRVDFHADFTLQSLPAKWGFKSFLLDTFDAPDAVKAFIVSKNPFSRNVLIGSDATDAFAAEIEAHGKIRQFFTPKFSFASKQTRYGSKAVQTTQSKMKEARVLHQSVDRTKVDQLMAQLATLKTTIAENQQEFESLRRQETELVTQHQALKAEKASIQNVRLNLKTAERELDRLKSSLKTEADRISATQQNITKTREQLAQLQTRRIAGVLRLQTAVDVIVTNQMESVEHSLRCSELQKEITVFDDAVRVQRVKFEELNERYKAAEQSMTRAKAAARQKMEIANRSCKEEDVSGLQKDLETTMNFKPANADELLGRLNAERAMLGSMANVNRNAVQENDQLKQRILDTEKDFKDVNSKHNDNLAYIEKMKSNWLVWLRNVVGTINDAFSDNFKNLGCSGAVELHEEEDFSKFSILIKVKFRATQKLMPLTATYQSGGERSVSTISYLMALQQLTYCPFRVVDEINQGMDAVYERKVYSVGLVFTRTSSEESSLKLYSSV